VQSILALVLQLTGGLGPFGSLTNANAQDYRLSSGPK